MKVTVNDPVRALKVVLAEYLPCMAPGSAFSRSAY